MRQNCGEERQGKVSFLVTATQNKDDVSWHGTHRKSPKCLWALRSTATFAARRSKILSGILFSTARNAARLALAAFCIYRPVS
ncbi:hypothetical protein EDC15_10293 [Acetobacter aceti NBRC 14818]|nr:hypothetical protein EDC15_10293 [Acetobacter aceti NBRC 14818]